MSDLLDSALIALALGISSDPAAAYVLHDTQGNLALTEDELEQLSAMGFTAHNDVIYNPTHWRLGKRSDRLVVQGHDASVVPLTKAAKENGVERRRCGASHYEARPIFGTAEDRQGGSIGRDLDGSSSSPYLGLQAWIHSASTFGAVLEGGSVRLSPLTTGTKFLERNARSKAPSVPKFLEKISA